jgi:hypothetical protein
MTDVGYNLGHETQAAKVMYLDSRDGTSALQDGSAFTVVFEETMTTRQDEGLLVSLLSATIPYSFYNIRQGVNDAVSFVEATLDGSQSVVHTVTLESGNYTVTAMRLALQDKATQACLDIGILNTVITIDYDRTQQKFKFSTPTADRRVTLQFLTIVNPMHTELGFPGLTNPEFASDLPLTSVNVVDINGSIHAVHIRTDLPTLAVYDSLSGKASDILSKVTLNTNPGGIIFHDPRDTKHESLLRSSALKSVRVKLTDERARPLSLNGLHFQVGLLFRFVSLKMADPLIDLRRLLTQQPPPPPKGGKPVKKNKKAQRKRALQRGKQKIAQAQQKARIANTAQEQTKTSGTVSTEKPSIQS